MASAFLKKEGIRVFIGPQREVFLDDAIIFSLIFYKHLDRVWYSKRYPDPVYSFSVAKDAVGKMLSLGIPGNRC